MEILDEYCPSTPETPWQSLDYSAISPFCDICADLGDLLDTSAPCSKCEVNGVALIGQIC